MNEVLVKKVIAKLEKTAKNKHKIVREIEEVKNDVEAKIYQTLNQVSSLRKVIGDEDYGAALRLLMPKYRASKNKEFKELVENISDELTYLHKIKSAEGTVEVLKALGLSKKIIDKINESEKSKE